MPPPLWVAFLTALVATPLLAGLARAMGLGDDPRRAAERKRQAEPVPPVGGAALLLALLGARLFAEQPLFTSPLGQSLEGGESLAWLALGAGFLLGLADDLRADGVPPWLKLAGQTVAGFLFAFALGASGPLSVLALAGAAVVAQNLANTFDHADGFLAASGLAGLAPSLAAGAGALAGFLPWNLLLRRASGTPRAYLGDSGSHLVGLLLLLSPLGWIALWPAALDLARVVRLRLLAREPIWRGDRRHLGHRLQDAGLAPPPVALAGVLPALPLALLLGCTSRGPLSIAVALLASLALYLLLVRRTRAGRPCPDPEPSR